MNVFFKRVSQPAMKSVGSKEFCAIFNSIMRDPNRDKIEICDQMTLLVQFSSISEVTEALITLDIVSTMHLIYQQFQIRKWDPTQLQEIRDRVLTRLSGMGTTEGFWIWLSNGIANDNVTRPINTSKKNKKPLTIADLIARQLKKYTNKSEKFSGGSKYFETVLFEYMKRIENQSIMLDADIVSDIFKVLGWFSECDNGIRLAAEWVSLNPFWGNFITRNAVTDLDDRYGLSRLMVPKIGYLELVTFLTSGIEKIEPKVSPKMDLALLKYVAGGLTLSIKAIKAQEILVGSWPPDDFNIRFRFHSVRSQFFSSVCALQPLLNLDSESREQLITLGSESTLALKTMSETGFDSGAKIFSNARPEDLFDQTMYIASVLGIVTLIPSEGMGSIKSDVLLPEIRCLLSNYGAKKTQQKKNDKTKFHETIWNQFLTTLPKNLITYPGLHYAILRYVDLGLSVGLNIQGQTTNTLQIWMESVTQTNYGAGMLDLLYERVPPDTFKMLLNTFCSRGFGAPDDLCVLFWHNNLCISSHLETVLNCYRQNESLLVSAGVNLLKDTVSRILADSDQAGETHHADCRDQVIDFIQAIDEKTAKLYETELNEIKGLFFDTGIKMLGKNDQTTFV